MVNKKSGIIIAAIITLFSFVTVAYISCTKPGPSLNTCEGYVCSNGGYCYVDTILYKPHCVCPVGFEGSNCATPVVSKYIANWNVTQTIGSDSLSDNGVSNYTISIKNSATPTTFFINNLAGDPYYTYILCSLDSANSYNFTIDTISALHMLFDHYTILNGSGSISTDGSSITANLLTKHLTPSTNWVMDTISLVMTKQ